MSAEAPSRVELLQDTLELLINASVGLKVLPEILDSLKFSMLCLLNDVLRTEVQ